MILFLVLLESHSISSTFDLICLYAKQYAGAVGQTLYHVHLVNSSCV